MTARLARRADPYMEEIMTDLLHEIHIAPSILSADFSRLGHDVEAVLNAGARVIHVDVMDGHFVPNITIGPLIVEALQPLVHGAGALIDVHLMIEHPERYVDAFAAAGANVITVHQEACVHLHRVLMQIREAGAAAGVALNPATPIETLAEVREHCDLVEIMSVNPGFGGQRFIETSLDKLERARAFLPDSVALELDGGVSALNAGTLVAAGANLLVAGSSVFGGRDIGEQYAALAQAAGEAV
jgi:ribulose-phosphate 3-epimerase